MICIELPETGERICIEQELWVRRQRNGTVVITPHRVKAQGVGDGAHIWSLGDLEGYPEARIITRAEYEETLTAPEEDPELTDAEVLAIIMGGSYETE